MQNKIEFIDSIIYHVSEAPTASAGCIDSVVFDMQSHAKEMVSDLEGAWSELEYVLQSLVPHLEFLVARKSNIDKILTVSGQINGIRNTQETISKVLEDFTRGEFGV